MDIDGLGEEIIEDFFNLGYIKSIVDIYHLDNHRKDLENLEGYGTKSINKLLDAIENSKKRSVERLIFGLGISGIGDKTALLLSKKYKNLDNLMNASYEELIEIKDIGPTLGKNIYEFFREDKNIELINKLRELSVNFNYLGEAEKFDELITNKKFVITGTIDNYSRDEIKKILESYGATVSDSVSKKTNYVIVGENPGSKEQKARDLNIEIWDNDKILSEIERLSK